MNKHKVIFRMGVKMKGIVFAIVYVIVIIIGSFYLINTNTKDIAISIYYGITVWSAIFTILINILNSQEEIKRNKLKEAIKIVNDFDNPDLREARNFTRRFKKEHDENNLQEGKLADFIDQTLSDGEMKEFMDKYKFKDEEEIYKLKSSLIYMFNYFQSVYTIIKSDMADKNYILRCMKDVYLQLFDRFKIWINRNCNTCDKNQFNDLVKLEELANNFKEQK